MRLLPGIILAGSLVTSQVAAEPAGQHMRRQSQYASFSNSSRPAIPSDSTSTSVEASSSSSEPALFSYSPETSASLTASPVPSISSISSTSLPSETISSNSAISQTVSSSPLYPSSGSDSLTASSSFPITASPIRPPIKHQCVGQTVNVRNASFDWWNSYTIDHPVSTLSFQHDSAGEETGWTILPDPAPFTVANSFQSWQCDDAHPLTGTDVGSNNTWTYFDCSMVPLTVAASTTVTTLTAFKKPSATTGTDFDVPDIRATHPPDPSITFNTPNATFTPVTDFVYFTQYEVEDSDTTTYDNGSAACVTATSSYTLSVPYALTYTGEDPQSAADPTAAVTGDVAPDFLSYIGRANATAGSYTALPTVIVIVREVFRATFALYAVPMMHTATSLATPTAELPPGISASSTSDNWAADLYSTLTASARIESTAQILLVPPPVSTNSATALQQQVGPGDANSVLSNALGPAIMQGIGASSPTQQVAIGTNTASRTSVVAVLVGGQTAVAGGAPITVGGNTISVAGSGSSVIVNGQTSQLSGGSPSTLAIDGIQLTATRAAAFAVAGQTAAAGGAPITVDGTKVSLASGGNAMMIGTSTLALSPPGVITVAAQTITADPATRFALAPGQTLTPGGSASISGTTVTLLQAGTAIVIDGKTTQVGTVTANYAQITSGPVLVVDGQSYTPNKGGAYVIAGQSLLAGGAITFTGKQGVETVSLDRSGTVVVDVISGKSITTTLASSPPITLAGRVYTAYPGGATYVINSQTLTPGSVKTVTVAGGTYILSLASTPTAVVIQTLSNGRPVATSTELLTAASIASASPANKSPTAESNAVTTSAPATGQASSMMMEMLAALFGAAALGLAAIL